MLKLISLNGQTLNEAENNIDRISNKRYEIMKRTQQLHEEFKRLSDMIIHALSWKQFNRWTDRPNRQFGRFEQTLQGITESKKILGLASEADSIWRDYLSLKATTRALTEQLETQGHWN